MTPPSMRGRQSARTSLGEKGFPVMMQTLDPHHYRVEEVMAVEKKTVPADMFAVPKDFAKTHRARCDEEPPGQGGAVENAGGFAVRLSALRDGW